MKDTNDIFKEMPFSKEDILRILKQYPELNEHGICYYPKQEKEEESQRVSSFFSDIRLKRIEFSYNWLKQIKKIKSINYRHSSRGLKHIVEWIEGCPGSYMPNGLLIVGALLCGFTMKRESHTSPYVYFNISQKSLKNTDAYKKKYNIQPSVNKKSLYKNLFKKYLEEQNETKNNY